MGFAEKYPFPTDESESANRWWDVLRQEAADHQSRYHAERRERYARWVPILKAMTREERAEFHRMRHAMAASFRSVPGTGASYSEENTAEKRLHALWSARLAARLAS